MKTQHCKRENVRAGTRRQSLPPRPGLPCITHRADSIPLALPARTHFPLAILPYPFPLSTHPLVPWSAENVERIWREWWLARRAPGYSTVSLANAVFHGHERKLASCQKDGFRKVRLLNEMVTGWVCGAWTCCSWTVHQTRAAEQTFVGLSERAARAAFQPILDSVNAASGATPPVPKRTATLSAVIREWL